MPDGNLHRQGAAQSLHRQASDDAAVLKDLKLPTAQLIIRKGFHKDVDSYSAFEEADRKISTGLAAYLKARGRVCRMP